MQVCFLFSFDSNQLLGKAYLGNDFLNVDWDLKLYLLISRYTDSTANAHREKVQLCRSKLHKQCRPTEVIFNLYIQ